MITQQTLKKDVLEYLRKNYSIKLQIPTFKRHLSDKINLKLFRSPLGDELFENRYRLLISLSQDLLKKNIINTDKIKQFGECFFETINQDILVMQNNEQIRRNFTRIRDQITYRIEELTVEQTSIEQECRMINDKEDILIFLEGSFKNYLSNVKVVSQHYDAVNNVQVYTSINIDNIYSEKLANEEDYIQHYQPLLEVMQRLKSNMIKLYQELNRCQYYQLPLKSVNFLANCKNLLLQLQPFLIKNDCVFNRLIFHVTRGQKQNNRLISNAFQSNIFFTNDIIADIFKSFFLGHIFKDYYLQIQDRIQKQRQELIKYFESKFTTYDNFLSYVYKLNKSIQEIYTKIKSLKRVIGNGKDKIMRQYLGRKQCKKSRLLQNIEQQCKNIKKFALSMQNFLKHRNRIQFLKQKTLEAEKNITFTINSLKQLEINNIRTVKPINSNIKEIELILDKRIQESYVILQDGLISIQQMILTLKQAKQLENEKYFQQNFFPENEQILSELLNKYNDYQITLLNNYQNLRKQKLIKAEETKVQKIKTFEELNDYFQNKVISDMGFQIRNQDQECQEVKDYIIKIEKLEFMIYNFSDNKNTSQIQELEKFKINLQWLLQVFQGSMDEQIFEKFIQKLNFDIQDWKQQANRVKQLIKQLVRYVHILKSILKSNSISKIHHKVFKMIKNRAQLYEIIQDMFEQFILIYQTCKQSTGLNISDYGLKIYDEPTYKYVLMLYQYKNRMRAEVQQIKDLLLPKRTINYLMDELYEPFIHIFNNYADFTEQQLLNFTLRLEHALNFKSSRLQIEKLFQTTLSKPYFKGYFQSIKKICSELMQLQKQNNKVLQLQQEQIMIYQLSNFKDDIGLIKEHIQFSTKIFAQLEQKCLTLDFQLNNKKLSTLQEKLIKQWNQNKQQAEKSLDHSRADDFSQHNQT